MDFSVIDKAGVSKTEFAKLMRTSRTTVHSWMGGGGSHAMISTRLRRVLSTMERAVKAGRLPLKGAVARKDRVPAITKILKEISTEASAD